MRLRLLLALGSQPTVIGQVRGLTANDDAPSAHVLRAGQLLYEDAKRRGDHIMLRHLRQHVLGDGRTKREATSDAATLLRRRVADLKEDGAK